MNGDADERLRNAIKFFRNFQNQSERELYRKSVLKFCDLVEDILNQREVEQILTGGE